MKDTIFATIILTPILILALEVAVYYSSYIIKWVIGANINDKF